MVLLLLVLLLRVGLSAGFTEKYSPWIIFSENRFKATEMNEGQPSSNPTKLPILDNIPTSRPSRSPVLYSLSNAPINALEDSQPTNIPSLAHAVMDVVPSSRPSAGIVTVDTPTSFPTSQPSSSDPAEAQPTSIPTSVPSLPLPTSRPTSSRPTPLPTAIPSTLMPSPRPSPLPTATSRPSIAPSQAVVIFMSNVTFQGAAFALPLSSEVQSALLRVNAMSMMVDANSQFFEGAVLVVSQSGRAMHTQQSAQLLVSIATELALSSPYTNEVAVAMYSTLSGRLKDAVKSGYYTTQLQLDAEQQGISSMAQWTAVRAASRMVIPVIPDLQASDKKDEQLTLTYAILVLFGFLACVSVTAFAYMYWKSREPLDTETDRLLSRNKKAEEEVEMGMQRTSQWMNQYEKL